MNWLLEPAVLVSLSTLTGVVLSELFRRFRSPQDTAHAEAQINKTESESTVVAASAGFSLSQPAAIIPAETFVPVTSGGEITVMFNGAGKFDPDVMYNPATGIFTIQRTGIYDLGAVFSWQEGVAASTLGYRALGIRVNGTLIGERQWRQALPSASYEMVMTRNLMVPLNRGDTVDFRAYQNGGILSLKPASRVSVVCVQVL